MPKDHYTKVNRAAVSTLANVCIGSLKCFLFLLSNMFAYYAFKIHYFTSSDKK